MCPVIEHDGSLSRHDVHPPPGDNHSFAPEVWATVVSQFGEAETISIETAAKARKARIEAAREADPAGFSMSAGDQKASVIETCLYLRLFGEGVEGKAKKEWVRVLFGKFTALEQCWVWWLIGLQNKNGCRLMRVSGDRRSC